MNVSEEEIPKILTKYKSISVVGLSPDVSKPSHYVPLYMRENGWKITGTYPKIHSENEFQIYQTLNEIPREDRTFINVFRASDKIPDLVEELFELGGVEVLWLQLGIFHPEAEKKAENAGIQVVSNRCLIIEHRKFFTK
jgi:predicted CoA-binding protein